VDIINLILRVEEYISSGRDTNIIDPDQDGIYIYKEKEKERAARTNDEPAPKVSSSSCYPIDNWSSDLKRI
jgi:hypothetical protein